MDHGKTLRKKFLVPLAAVLGLMAAVLSPMPKVFAASNVSSLSGLTISVGTLSPTFATGTKSYSDGVAAATASVTVTPTKTNANSTIQVRINGGAYVSVTSGSPTGALTLDASPSTNPIDVLVTAEDAITTTKYTITVVRGAPAAPTNVSAVGESSSTATVYWTAVPGAGSYTATSSPGSITCTANAPAVSCGISTLTSGTSYTFTVTATNNTVTSAASIASNSITMGNAGSATKSIINVQPAGATNGVAFSTQPVVRIVNAEGRLFTNNSYFVVATITSGGGTLSGTTSVMSSSGVATFTNLVLTGAGASSTLTFTSGALIASTSVAFAVAPTSLQITTQPTGAVDGVAFTTQPVVRIVDPDMNTVSPVAAVTVAATIASGTGILSGTMSVSVSAGVATFTNLVITGTVGNFTLTFTPTGLAGLSAVTSSSFALISIPGIPTINSITPGNTQLTVAFTPGATGGSDITNYKYSTDGGVTWRSAATTSSPFTITTTSDANTALVHGTSYDVQIRAVNSVGDGTPTTSTTATPNSSYTVTFNGNTNSGGTMSSQSANTPTALTSNAFTKTSYSFSGWNTQAGGGGVAYANEATYDFGTDITLYAQWSGTTYTIIYDNNGGSGFRASGSFTAGGPALTLANGTGFSKSGYVFGGWSTTANDVGTIITTYAFNADANVYAIWVGIPTVTSFTPTSGGDGTSIAITGTNFIGATAVKIGGTDAANFHVHSSTQITAVVGSGATGTVSVVTPQGTATSGGIFTFLSSTATISALAISEGTLAPAFTGGTFTYTASVAYTVSSMTLTPTVVDPVSTVTVNGTSVTSGTASGPIALAVGTNTISIVVTAEDGTTTNTYTVTVTRTAVSTDATLHTLVISQGTLAPAFTESTFTYTASVAYAVSSMTLTPTVHSSAVTIRVNGVSVTSGTVSGSIALVVGPNVITIVVTAQDGSSTDTYTVTVTRTAVSTDAPFPSLSGLIISAGTLAPAFTEGTFTYTASVAYTVSSMTLTPTTHNSAATITVNGASVASGTASGSIPLAVGSNLITIVVTAENGTTTNTYTVTVTRTAVSTDATLYTFAISAGTLAPAFTESTFTYTASVAYTVSSMTLTPTVHSSAVTIRVNGASVASGSASGSIALAVGPNLISIVVTAQDGTTTHTYTVTVTRTAASTDATLHTLSISAGTLAPAFTDGTFAYTASVTSVTVTPTTHNSAATIRVNGASVASGSASGSIPLAVGPNRITIVVTAEDGITTNAYTVTVTRTAVSTDAHAIIHAKKLVIIGLRSRGITPIKINFPSKYFGKRATIELGTYKNGKWTIQTLGSVILNSLGDGTYKSKTAVLKGRLIRVKIGMMVLGRASY